MDTLNYILEKFELTPSKKGPTEIPNYGRDNLAELFMELGFTVGAEIGVERGWYAEILLKANPKLKLYCVDNWQVYEGYRDHISQLKLDTYFEETKTLLAPYDHELVRKFSMDAVNDFEDDSLDFVYIDASHELPWVMDDLCAWDKKVKPGGIISGHDYYKSKRKYTKCHVHYAVNCYTQAFRVRPWFVLGTRQKYPGVIRDKARSWMWVKQEINYGEYIRQARP